MKRFMIFVVAVIMAAGLSFGQKKSDCPDKARLCKALQGYKVCLKSENLGVRTSALYQLAKLKSCFPDLDLSEVMLAVDQVCKKDKEPIVRAQANLTYAYIADDSLCAKVKTLAADTPVEFFNRVQTELALRD